MSHTSSTTPRRAAPTAGPDAGLHGVVDPRGQRFSAAITAAVLAVALVTIGSSLATVLIAFQALVFALGVLVGPAGTPYAQLFARLVRPRIGAPTETEDARPPRFAQSVGLVFTLIALVASLVGAAPVAAVAVGFALAAALLNAVTGFCLGCEMYLIVRRVSPQRA
ncbi:DUF4395 domain-containing protein [Mumia sp. zg.B53]|uniref:DUF4395 domain-containing protein n=1 Tax=unclassified Mumia TaxID=2621872 RepID=UPI001C6DDCDF|nr:MULTISPECIES: DUF4395 domain-containing protein [unclassified Mumia]MBW9207205.1 DUF4395 domain-containing protein [Mumia sp. zg.B17]MBW9210446.1 DUF4395 domain-containing protein [Mumia sp. zg.B21]MBW9215068.1 DUF4395 domain-containing protein [Mumia sp. zg.B53]MDD9347928.1 DUF4395 domain-containing protein [Mumia sp.]